MTAKNTKVKLAESTIIVTDEWLAGVDIQEDRYFSISEVSSLCFGVKTHVLRYWESQFKTLSPLRRNDRRYYKRSDVILIRKIFNLVHHNRYTVEGAQKFLAAEQTNTVKNSDYTTKSSILSIIGALESIDEALTA